MSRSHGLRPVRWCQILLAPLLLAAGSHAVAADGRWAAEIHLGAAWNLPLPLVIRQSGYDDLDFRAHWNTRALDTPLYYVARVVTHDGSGGWALDLVHHKLYLSNPPSEVGYFAVSHGYNLLALHRLMEHGQRRLGLGGGLVIAHPESEVRGQRYDQRGGPFGGGYHVTGPSLSALASWLPERRDGFYATVEARLTLSYARVPVVNGEARVPNVALHLTVGAGWDGPR